MYFHYTLHLLLSGLVGVSRDLFSTNYTTKYISEDFQAKSSDTNIYLSKGKKVFKKLLHPK